MKHNRDLKEGGGPIRKGIVLSDGTIIPWKELGIRFSRSSGPGGQHVNKVNTRVTIRFCPRRSKALSLEQKELIERVLSSRLTRDGHIQVSCSRFRSQSANRKEAERILARLIEEGLKRKRPRIATRPTRSARERRMETKRRRSRIKALRRRPLSDAY